MNEPAPTLATMIAANVRARREALRWTAQRLAEEMTTAGVPWERVVVTKLETGRRQSITVEELRALGEVFGVEPWNLTRQPNCGTCFGMPMSGFTCNECGARHERSRGHDQPRNDNAQHRAR